MLIEQLIENRHTGQVISGPGFDKDPAFDFLRRRDTKSGIVVDADSATTVSSVYAAIRLLSWTPGILPWGVFQRETNGDRELRKEHPVYRLLNKRPNPEQTPAVWQEAGQAMVLLWGRAINFIERNGMGVPIGLWPMHTSQVQLGRTASGQRIYGTKSVDDRFFAVPPNLPTVLMEDEVLDVQNFLGTSVITHARIQLGENIAAQEFGEGHFAGGTVPDIAIKHPGKLKGDGPSRLRKNWEKIHGGAVKRTAVLEEGMDIVKLGMPAEDAQFIEYRKFAVAEVARWFGLPPHKLADLDHATFSNIEEQRLEFHEGMLPWLKRWEQEADFKLFTQAEQRDMFTEHIVDAFLAGDIDTRYKAHHTALDDGWLSRNEVRRMENKPSLGPIGDVLTVNANTIRLDEVGARTANQPAGSDDDDRDLPNTLNHAWRLFLRSVDRLIDRDAAQLRTLAKRPQGFLDAVEKHYGGFSVKMAAELDTIGELYRSLGVDVNFNEAIQGYCDNARESIVELTGECKPDELADRVSAELDRSRTLKAEQFGRRALRKENENARDNDNQNV